MNAVLQRLARSAAAVPALLICVLLWMVYAISAIVRDAPIAMLSIFGILGAGLAWRLGARGLTARRAWAAIAVLGPLGIWLGLSHAGAPLALIGLSMTAVPAGQILWSETGILPDYSTLAAASQALLANNAGLAGHLAAWLGLLAHGKPVNDTTIRALVWCLAFWFAAAWAGWRLRRHRQAWLAAAPTLALLAALLDYIGKQSYLLVVELGLILLLVGVSRYEERMAEWRRRGMDFAESIAFDTGMAVTGLTLGLTALAAITPSLSVRAMVDYVREHRRESSDRGAVASSLGLDPAPAQFGQYYSPGLPNQHLIQDPPELREQVVMKIRTGDLPPIPDTIVQLSVPFYYWRSTTYDIYTGSGWTTGSVQTQDFAKEQPLLAQRPASVRVVEQDVQRANKAERQVFWTGALLRMDRPLEAAWRTAPGASDPFLSADLFGALSDGDTYHAQSVLTVVSLPQLRAAPDDYPPSITARYLQLPEHLPFRVLALARDLTSTAPTAYDRAKAIEAHLRTFPYTLEVGSVPIDRDVADYFLFDLRKGYCDYYATGMVVLARAAGLPARLVNGYASGIYDSRSGQYVVRGIDAHAWAEIYFSGIGWIEFEPTAAMPEIRRPTVQAPPASLGSTGLSTPTPGFLERWSRQLASLPHWTALVLGLALTGLVLWQLVEAHLLARLPAQRALGWEFRMLYRLGRTLTGPLPPGTTASEFADLLRAQCAGAIAGQWTVRLIAPAAAEIRLLTDTYQWSLFGATPPGRPQVLKALRAAGRLRWRLLAARWLPRAGNERAGRGTRRAPSAIP